MHDIVEKLYNSALTNIVFLDLNALMNTGIAVHE